jgi:carbamoyl-phosphate synthase large subunit
MPKRTDIKRILLVGSGPIIIGQACEFDYSGTQACKALKQEGYEIILLNSNPATIMTDPEYSDRTYVEPITLETLEKIFQTEKPDAFLPTIGGQTALNLAVDAHEAGLLEKYNVELIGAKFDAIQKAEDRSLFKEAMFEIGLELPKSGYARTFDEAASHIDEIGFPVIIRPSFTLGGTGGSVAYNVREFEDLVRWGLAASPRGTILIEESVIGWKEFELEVMRDLNDNVVIVCSIENIDAMGVHTGDSVTVAPAQTLTDKEYQIMRDASLAIIRQIGVETGGSNIQFAVNPENGHMVVIEMNPRVSRSSALASKATGFPIAKIAAKLAVGYRLDEIVNDITMETPACFEPTIDYCVVKFPRFDFEKFPAADHTLTTQMKSVGEAMSIGRTFKEALQKALRSLENGRYSLVQPSEFINKKGEIVDEKGLRDKLLVPCWNRIWYIAEALRAGYTIEEVHHLTKIDPWFLENIAEIARTEEELVCVAKERWRLPLSERWEEHHWRQAKQMGFSDLRLAELLEVDEATIREERKRHKITATFKMVDTCGAEFRAKTPYFYSTYETECEAKPSNKRKVMILGGGPNRIGQGIEFDYCCVHAAFALKEAGYETIMVNCNPETVSTDYDTSDRLYFEPLTFEEVMNIVDVEKPTGVILQFGGQTPLKLAKALEHAGVHILGTSPDSIDLAEDRKRFNLLLHKLGLRQAPNGLAESVEEAIEIGHRIDFPIVVRPSYVLGGRAMQIVFDEEQLEKYMTEAVRVSPEHPVLIDRFLQDAIEVDVDAVCDGESVTIGGIMEQIEQAGVHSGDSSCALPPFSLSKKVCDVIREQTRALALELHVRGLINIQFAIQGDDVYVLEVNPRASRTIPFVSKAIGIPLAKIAARIMVGATLQEIGFTEEVVPAHIAVKEAVYPFIKFPGTDTLLGPEMKSTGEVMGIASDFGTAFAKSQISANNRLPSEGRVFLSVRDADKQHVPNIGRILADMGFAICSTKGTAVALEEAGIPVETVVKVAEGRPNIVDAILNKEIALVINTVFGSQTVKDSYRIRRSALEQGVPYFTTIQEAFAAIKGLAAGDSAEFETRPLQDYYGSADS